MSLPTTPGEPLWESLDGLLGATSRTFAMGIRALPRGLRQEVTLAYLILRVSDYLEDNTVMRPAEKVVALGAWVAVLAGKLPLAELTKLVPIDDAVPDSRALVRGEDILRGLSGLRPAAADIITRHTIDSTEGMSTWISRGPVFSNEGDLDDYMHEVAGRVGFLLTDLFALRYPGIEQRKPELAPLAREFGLALQTVNVIRGLSADHLRGWVYVPRTFLPEGVDFATLLEHPESDAAVTLVNRLGTKAEAHLVSAQAYIRRLPRGLVGVRFFCLVPYFLAVRTVALSRGNAQVLTGEVKVPRATVRSIVVRTRVLGFSNTWIRRHADALAMM